LLQLLTIRATEIHCKNRTIITAISSDYRGAAGARHSLVIFDELWGYDSETAQRLFEELTPPPTEENLTSLTCRSSGLKYSISLAISIIFKFAADYGSLKFLKVGQLFQQLRSGFVQGPLLSRSPEDSTYCHGQSDIVLRRLDDIIVQTGQVRRKSAFSPSSKMGCYAVIENHYAEQGDGEKCRKVQPEHVGS
jgi:hypothetical protein